MEDIYDFDKLLYLGGLNGNDPIYSCYQVLSRDSKSWVLLTWGKIWHTWMNN